MGPETTFIHLSDPHIVADDEPLFGTQPAEQVRRLLEHILALPIEPAFCLLTGDLTQDGEEASYRRLRQLLAPLEARGIPVFAGLGNHDQRAAFRVGFLGEEAEEDRYYYATEVAGLRIIMLDSLMPKSDAGSLGTKQLAWLGDQLATDAPRGTIIALHHPVALGAMPWLENDLLRDAGELAALLRKRPILGVLAGHCHASSAARFADTVTATAPAIVFQAIPGIDHFATRPGSGCNLCTVRDGALLVTTLML